MSALLRVPQRGVSGFHQRDGFGDRDGLLLLAGLDDQVNSNFLTDAQLYANPLDLLEAFGLGTNRIYAGNQVGSVILSRVIRVHGP